MPVDHAQEPNRGKDAGAPRQRRSDFSLLTILVLILALGGIWFWQNWTPPSAVSWMDDPAEAFARARTEGKPLLVRFELPRCPTCRALDREVFSDAEVGRRVAKAFVALTLELGREPVVADRPALADRYDVTAAPTCVIVAADGQVLAGPQGPRGNDLRQWFDRFMAAGLAAFGDRSTPSRPAGPPTRRPADPTSRTAGPEQPGTP